MQEPEAAWTIRLDDTPRDRGGHLTKEGAFTDLYILFIDAATGERSVASAKVPGEHGQLLERRIPERGIAPAMDASEAQALVEEAASATNGKWMRRYWIVLEVDQLIARRSGEKRPADDITPGDSVLLEPHRELLYVWDRWEREDDGRIELTLGEAHEGRQFDAERKLLELERNAHQS